MNPNKPRIAIVEDDADQRHSIEEFLHEEGYPVWGADSAESFYKRFMTHPVDVVVLDIGLPGEDGLSVAELLKSRPEVGTIILSARDGLSDRLSGMRAGADRYLVKPVNLLELAMNIDAAASRSQPTAHASALGSAAVLATPSPVAGCWTLRVSDWLLCSPQGKTMPLTTHEFLFVQRLMSTQGQPVAKRELTDQLFGSRAPNGNERLNLMLTRLRKKAAEALTEPLPIKTLHQIGYAFTAAAQMG